jgi:DNA repair exonuclease SbcCD ATPase subunit
MPSVSLYLPHLEQTEPRICLQHQEHQEHFHNTLSLVVAEVIELREKMLQEDVQKLKEEMKHFRQESRASIAKLGSRMNKLSQTDDDLRDHLSTTREDLEQRERYINTLNQQLVLMSSASREHVH